MKCDLKEGLSTSRRILIDKPRTIDFLGESLRVYATPELVRDFETVCREFLLGYVDAGEDSVGTGIELAHTGAPPLGMSVEITVKLARVKGRMVSFDLLARDGADEIGRGSHSRFVVEIEKLRSKVAAKMEMARA